MNISKILLVEKDIEFGLAFARAVTSLHNEFEITVTQIDKQDCTGQPQGIDAPHYDLVIVGGYSEELIKSCFFYAMENVKILVFTEHEVDRLITQYEKDAGQFLYLYKYVNINDIISDLIFLLDSMSGRKSLLRKSFAPDMIGFYSSAGGTGKTAVAISTARELSRYHDKKVLYLSFEEIPTTSLLFLCNNHNRNLGDYLYFLFEKKDPHPWVTPVSFVSADSFGVDTFYPANGRNDLNNLSHEELVFFLKAVSDHCKYDFIIFDLKNDLSDETIFLMNQCIKIIFVQDDNPVSQFKNRKCIAFLERYRALKDNSVLILAMNKSCRCDEDEDAEYTREHDLTLIRRLKRIYIEKDENSFRYYQDNLYMDINHSFGIGIKKIAEEVLSTDMEG